MTQQTSVCSSCGKQNPWGQQFCGTCGARLFGGQQQAYGLQQTYSCSKCGQAVAQGVNFCGSCGTPLNWPAQKQPQQQEAYGNGQEKTEHQKINSGLIVYIVLIIATLLVGGWVLVFTPGSQKTPPSSSSTSITPPASTPPASPQQEPSKAVCTYCHLLLVYPNTDVVYIRNDVSQRFTGTMSSALKTAVMTAFKNLPELIKDGSAGMVSSTYEIVEIPRSITKITALQGGKYWLSYEDIHSDLEQYAPKSKYDSVHVVWNSGPIDAYFGMGGVFINDMTTTFSSLIAGQEWWWARDGKASGEAFLHEWLHAVCRLYANLGYPMPEGDADGADEHGYTESPSDGWMGYYRDLMVGQVWEPKLSARTGITKEAWSKGTPKQTLSSIQPAPGPMGVLPRPHQVTQ